MAGSRLEKIGTVYSRAFGLIKTGAISYKDRPIWFDVYRVFPPKYEPLFDRVPEVTDDVPNLFYKEDAYRAAFYKKFGPNPRISRESRDLLNYDQPDPSDKFVSMCEELKDSNADWSTEKVVESALESIGPLTIETQAPGGEGMGQRFRGRPRGGQGRQLAQEDDWIDEESQGQEPPQSHENVKAKKLNIITEETLRSLFDKAKNKDD